MAPHTPAKLVGTDGTRYYAWHLTPGSYEIGRKDGLACTINDRTVSRQHARIDVDTTGAALQLVDLGSHNGTLVNGRRISEPTPLKIGDIVFFGQTEFKIVAVADNDIAAAPAPRSAQLAENDPEKSVVLDWEEVRKNLAPASTTSPDVMAAFFELGKMLVLAEPKETMLRKALQLVGKIVPSERLTILFVDSGEFVPIANFIQSGSPNEKIQLSRTILKEIYEQKTAVLVGGTADDSKYRKQESIILAELKSAMAVPLFDEEHVLGVLYVDTRNPLHQYSDETLRMLATCGNLIASRLLNYELLQERQEKQVLAAELLRASRIQQNLLAKDPPSVAGYACGTFQVQSRQVGGDLYDTALLPDGRLLMLVADVSGKGLGAALLMSNILASFRILYNNRTFDLASAVKEASLELNRHSAAEDFATLFLAILTPSSGLVQYVNAGHNSPLVVSPSGEIQRLDATGFMIGAFPFGEWGEQSVTLQPGDLLYLYTDGVTEAEGPTGLFGEERLDDLLRRHVSKGPAELESILLSEIKAFVDNTPQSDDITMLILKRH